MERNKTKRKENELTAELITEVEKNKKEASKLATATKPKATKQPKAAQAEMPTEEKFLSAKDLAQMAGVAPTVLRRTLHSDFAGKILRGDGQQKNQYQIKATDPLVEEIIAKAKAGNGGKSKETPSSEGKEEDDKPSPESLEGKVVK